jgi:hypothetical protein
MNSNRDEERRGCDLSRDKTCEGSKGKMKKSCNVKVTVQKFI